MQLEAQLADRNVTIELTDEARNWLVENGYDEAMGARPMARVIQQTIKTPLADEVLFGTLKNGGTVRVVVTADESGAKKLGFVFPEGPVLPRPERDIVEAGRKRKPRVEAESEEQADSEGDEPESREPEPPTRKQRQRVGAEGSAENLRTHGSGTLGCRSTAKAAVLRPAVLRTGRASGAAMRGSLCDFIWSDTALRDGPCRLHKMPS